MLEICLIIIHDPGMRPGPELNRGPLDRWGYLLLYEHRGAVAVENLADIAQKAEMEACTIIKFSLRRAAKRLE